MKNLIHKSLKVSVATLLGVTVAVAVNIAYTVPSKAAAGSHVLALKNSAEGEPIIVQEAQTVGYAGTVQRSNDKGDRDAGLEPNEMFANLPAEGNTFKLEGADETGSVKVKEGVFTISNSGVVEFVSDFGLQYEVVPVTVVLTTASGAEYKSLYTAYVEPRPYPTAYINDSPANNFAFPKQKIDISGEWFRPAEEVKLIFNDRLIKTSVADKNGVVRFNGWIVPDDINIGTNFVKLEGNERGATVVELRYVGGFSSVVINGNVDNIKIRQGEKVQIEGSGFDAYDNLNIILESANTRISAITANQTGEFKYTWDVPKDLLVGDHNIYIEARNSYPGFVNFEVLPAVSEPVPPSLANPGSGQPLPSPSTPDTSQDNTVKPGENQGNLVVVEKPISAENKAGSVPVNKGNSGSDINKISHKQELVNTGYADRRLMLLSFSAAMLAAGIALVVRARKI